MGEWVCRLISIGEGGHLTKTLLASPMSGTAITGI